NATPDARVVVAGDLNVYPRPDDPFAPIGQAGSTDQLGSLYDQALGLTNLWSVLLAQAPQSAYSYVYLGMAQTLDQMFVNAPQRTDLAQFRIAHINSDFPADYPIDVARGTSDHDPNVGIFRLYDFAGFFQPVDNPPKFNTAKAGTGIPVKFGLGGNDGLGIFAPDYPQSTQVDCESKEPTGVEETATAGQSSLQYDPTTDRYIYAWKTDKTWAGTCRRLTVRLADGTDHIALFQFTK
ncbi:MAG: PxKF domain-containing protein, partial [Rudaea sp.]